MGEIKNQAIKNSIVSYAGAALGFVNFIILLPYVFTLEQIGLTRLLQNAAYLMVPFAEFGIISIVLRFYPVYKEENNQRYSFIFYCLAGALAGFIFFTLAFILLKEEISSLFIDKSPLFIDYYYYIIPLLFFIVFTGIMEAVANGMFKTVFPNFLREVFIRFIISVLALLYLLHLINFDDFLQAFILGYFLPLLLLIIYLFRKNAIRFSFTFKSIPRHALKEMMTYGLFIILGSSGYLLVSYIDTMMIGAILGLEETGIYVTAFYMAVVIEIPRRSIKQIASPIISDAWKRNDLKQIEDIYSKTSLNQLIIGAFIFLGVWINIDSIFQLMPNGEDFQAGKFVVFYVMLGKLIDMASGVNGEIIAFSKLYRFNIYSILILAALAIVTNLIFIPIYGFTGAAMATAISLLFYNILKYLFLKIRLRMEPFSVNTLKVLVIAAGCYFIIALIPQIPNALFDIIVRSVAITLIFGFTIYLTKVSEDVNVFVKNIWNRIFN